MNEWKMIISGWFIKTYRLSVPGGWLVKDIFIDMFPLGMVFVADPKGEWK